MEKDKDMQATKLDWIITTWGNIVPGNKNPTWKKCHKCGEGIGKGQGVRLNFLSTRISTGAWLHTTCAHEIIKTWSYYRIKNNSFGRFAEYMLVRFPDYEYLDGITVAHAFTHAVTHTHEKEKDYETI